MKISFHKTNNGLAVYSTGEGQPILLMPYPHGFSICPIIEGELAKILVDTGYRVVSFDPPGIFRSMRLPEIAMSEMLDCAEETLRFYNLTDPIFLVGHSMGGLCSIAFSLLRPSLVQKLVLIGSVSGGPAIMRGKGMPWGMKYTNIDFWRFISWGWRLSSGMGNLALHKKLLQLIWRYSYVDRNFIPKIEIASGDKHLPAPIRDRWPIVVRHLDYHRKINEIQVPTLICVGRFDPQAPVSCSEELAQNIPNAKLEIFDRSGHYPFIEERYRFTEIVSTFLSS